MKTFRTLWTALFLSCVGVSAAMAEGEPAALRLPKIFSDHMVLQRGMPIPVYGWAGPGDTVRVTLGKQSASAVVADDGRWIVRLPKRRAGGPYELIVTDGTLTKSYQDVVVGEVWLCSGQSNMTLPLSETQDGDKEAAAASNPSIRFFHLNYDLDHLANQPKDDFDGEGYGWECCSPGRAGAMSAVAYYLGKALQRELDVPIGLIHSSWGGVAIAAFTPREGIVADPDLAELLKDWDRQWADYRATGDEAKNPNRHENFNNAIQQPAGLYNGAIAPFVPYGLRGVAWYQGETDAGNPAPYCERLTRMIHLWRQAWGLREMPFLIVQLPNFGEPTEGPAESGWAQVRDAQRQAAEATGSEFIVTIDVGEADNIHPMNKEVVGERVARAALARVYGRRGVCYSGPVVKSVRCKKDTLVVKFRHARGGLCTSDGGRVNGFVIADSTGQFRKAEARIDGRRVVVSSPDIGEPARVRYAWADNPVCNLCNKAQLPAGPFQAEAR
ncbi:MAG: sialate O-acetylesterase [Candidatus Hydrogenedentes bacterium]|nr:sialate O-acetylesterase [Candidatus Hydrogenedentota bacterium]